MKILNVIADSFGSWRSLQRKYVLLNSFIQACSCVTGFIFIFQLEPFVSKVLNINYSAPIEFKIREFMVLLSLIVVFTLCLYVGFLIIGSGFSVFMHIVGKFTKREAFLYAVLGRYPKHWLK